MGMSAKALESTSELPMHVEHLRTVTEAVQSTRKYFVNGVIRRTGSSLDCDGNPISGLPPWAETVMLLKPLDIESTTLMAVAEATLKEHRGEITPEIANSKVSHSLGLWKWPSRTDTTDTRLCRWVAATGRSGGVSV